MLTGLALSFNHGRVLATLALECKVAGSAEIKCASAVKTKHVFFYYSLLFVLRGEEVLFMFTIWSWF